MDQLMQICNLGMQRTRSDGQAFKSVHINQENRNAGIDISSVFLFS